MQMKAIYPGAVLKPVKFIINNSIFNIIINKMFPLIDKKTPWTFQIASVLNTQ